MGIDMIDDSRVFATWTAMDREPEELLEADAFESLSLSDREWFDSDFDRLESRTTQPGGWVGDPNVGRESAIEVLTTAQMLKRPRPTFLVDDLVPRGALVLLFGRGGSGKSFLALDWSACISTGCDWFGRKVRRVPVVYVSLEPGSEARIEAWMAHNEIEAPLDLHWVFDSVDLRKREHRDRLIEIVRSKGASLLVLDTVARSLPGIEENSSKDLGFLVSFAEDLRRKTGATLLAIHHSDKNDKGSRGHSSLEDGADTSLHVKGQHNPRKVTVKKQRNGEFGMTIRFQIVPHDSTGSAIITTAGPIDTLDHSRKTEQRLVQHLVQNPEILPARHGELLRIATSELGMSKGSLNNALSSLVAKDFFAKTNDNNSAPYDWTEKGHDLIQTMENQ